MFFFDRRIFMVKNLPQLGWREWVALPELGITTIKCKVDTGARTSALHTSDCLEFERGGISHVRFSLTTSRRRKKFVWKCEAPIMDKRIVTDSGGHRELRYVILTSIQIGATCFPIEMTLTDRHSMRFPMLLGRVAMHRRFMVNPARSYLAGDPSATILSKP